MLKVTQIETQILNTEFKFSRYILNGNVVGYQGFVMVRFEIDGKKGYFDFYLNLILENKFSHYENKYYYCIPCDNAEEISYLESFDTERFYDVGDFVNPMKVRFGNISNNRIKMFLELRETFLSLDFYDDLQLV